MAQNAYNREDLFVAYSKLPRSVQGLDGAIEWPTMRRMVGEVQDAAILDLGCGAGHFCRLARSAGAKSVHGIDLSTRMLDHARSFPPDSGITYECKDLENISLPASTYDLVWSSVTLHLLPDLQSLFIQISRCLKPGGRFIFSVEHPIRTAPSSPDWRQDNDGVYWPLNHYADEGLRVTKWLGIEGVNKYHRTVETYMSLLLKNQLVLTGFRESWDGMESIPDKEERGQRPFLLMLSARV
ncbi:MAG: hypothetical protein Q9160_001978 [Pyrenula sp. 1 TL-2023]